MGFAASALESGPLRLVVWVVSTADWEAGWLKEAAPALQVRTLLRDGSDGNSFAFAHRELIRESAHEFDATAFCEDDVLLTPEHVAAFLLWAERLPSGWIPGFLR